MLPPPPSLLRRCVLRAPAPNTAMACARPPTPPTTNPVSATKGAEGDSQKVTLTLLPATDSGGTSE